MISIETERLILKSNCRVESGKLCFPPAKRPKSILNIEPSQSEDGGFAIYLKSGEEIGHIGLLFHRRPYELTVGVEREYRERHYMTEAQQAVVDWIFNNCNTDVITALVGGITPVACQKMLRKQGFEKLDDSNEEWWELRRESFLMEKQ